MENFNDTLSENSDGILTENSDKHSTTKKTWIKPAMRTLQTSINGAGDGDDENASGLAS